MTVLAMLAETAATEVPRAPIVAPHSYDEWQIAGMVVGGIVTIIVIIGGLIGIVDKVRSWGEKARTEEDKQLGEQRKVLAEGQATILTRMTENRDALERVIHEKFSAVELRVDRLEKDAKTFRPNDQLEKDFARLEGRVEHEKQNRLMAQEQAVIMSRDQMKLIMEGQREQSRFGAQLEASSGAIAKLEASLDRLASHIDERLDKMNDCLTTISRKVG